MKKIFFSILLLAPAGLIFAQDLIITNDGDSINCKITKVKGDNVYFVFRYKDETRSTLLPASAIRERRFGFYETSEVAGKKGGNKENFQRLRLALNGGYSWHTAKIAGSVPADFKDYVRRLKSGCHLGGDGTYFFNESFGAGIKYYLFKTSNSLDNIYVEDNSGNRTYGNMSDDLTVTFIGPAFSTRLLNYNKSNAFLMNLSLGYMGYANNKILIDKYRMTGSTAGLALDFAYDIGLSENLALGFQISFLSGMLSK